MFLKFLFILELFIITGRSSVRAIMKILQQIILNKIKKIKSRIV